MWESRKKFVPVYFKTKFFPFIQTTARCEGTNALFKKGVGAQFSMTSFLREYQRILDNIMRMRMSSTTTQSTEKFPGSHSALSITSRGKRTVGELYGQGVQTGEMEKSW